MTKLLDLVRRHADAHADRDGIATTPIPGLLAIRTTMPSDLDYAISRPLVAIVLQGAKHVTMGPRSFSFSAGESLFITADVPTVSQITRASLGEPYYSLVLELDPAVIGELSLQMKLMVASDREPVQVSRTEEDVADAALRLMRLLDRPSSLSVLKDQLVREMHYWLLAGRHGDAIRCLGLPDGHVGRIARAIALLRSDFARALPVDELAALAGMSVSSFHKHFRAVTTLSPLQFQKQLRLIEARRMMMSRGASASSAAFAVGYESVSQFTREYGRFFGLPPVKDIRTARTAAELIA